MATTNTKLKQAQKLVDAYEKVNKEIIKLEKKRAPLREKVVDFVIKSKFNDADYAHIILQLGR